MQEISWHEPPPAAPAADATAPALLAKRERAAAAAAPAPTHSAPPARDPATKRRKRSLRGRGGRRKVTRGKSVEYEVACVIEQLCLEVEAWGVLLPCHWPEQGGPGAHCARTNCDFEEYCQPCVHECIAADVKVIPTLLRDPRLVREAQEHAQDIRAGEPLRLPSLRHVPVPGPRLQGRPWLQGPHGRTMTRTITGCVTTHGRLMTGDTDTHRRGPKS